MSDYNYNINDGGEPKRALTKEYLENLTPYRVSESITPKKALTKSEVDHIVPKSLILTSPMWNKTDNRVVLREDIRFHSPIPNFGQGFDIVPRGITVNYRSLDRKYSISVAGGFSMYRRINNSNNCQAIICMASDGSYYQPGTTTPQQYVWGSPSGFTGNFDTTNYVQTTCKDIVTIYNKEGNTFTPYNIVIGTFTHYRGVSVPRVVCISGINGEYRSSRSSMPTYYNTTPVAKILEFEELPTQVALATFISYTNRAIYLITAPRYYNVGNTSIYEPTTSLVTEFQTNSQESILNVAKVNSVEYPINADTSNTYYLCGNFTKINGNTSIRYFAKYVKETNVFSSMNFNVATEYGSQIVDFDIQSDGKIIIIGRVKYNGEWYCVLRLNTNFSVDTTFNNIKEGIITVPFGNSGSSDHDNTFNGPACLSVVVQKTSADKDGILIGGRFTRIIRINDINGTPRIVPVGCFIKTDKNGNIDELWGLSGQTANNPKLGFWDDQLARIEKITLLPNGNYAMVGLFDSFNGIEVSGIHSIGINGTPVSNTI